MRRWVGLLRSFVVYWRPGRQRGLRRLYAPMVGEGDLVFDVGAHLGDRSVAFARLGARVVALEPQPFIARWLRRIVGTDGRVTVRNEAVGRQVGTARLSASRLTPTVSTLSDRWKENVRGANPSFRTVRWEDEVEVPMTTLDALIETYGTPTFCKIDVEGFESEVLAGLTSPVPAVSVEFVSGDLASSIACIRRLEALGGYDFNAIVGEGRGFVFDPWRDAEGVAAWLDAGAGGASSGDIYARLRSIDDPETDPTDHGAAR